MKTNNQGKMIIKTKTKKWLNKKSKKAKKKLTQEQKDKKLLASAKANLTKARKYKKIGF